MATDSVPQNVDATPSWVVLEPVIDSHACELILSSWSRITAGETDAFAQSGFETPKEFFFRSFYGRLFQIAPEARQFFRSSMEAQGRALFKLVDTAISMLPPDERLVKVLVELAQGHNTMGISLVYYYAVGENLVNTLAKCSGSSWNDDIQNAWINLYSLMMKVMKDHIHPVSRAVTDSYNVATITNIRDVSSSMKSFTLSIPFRFKYFPGQHIVMRIPADTGVTRSYTLTSTMFDTAETEFEVTVKKYEFGIASNWFHQAAVGANIVIHNAEGRTYLNPNEPESIPKKLLIISGGSGITPAVAALRCLVHFGNLDCSLTLLHSDRTFDDIYDFARLEDLTQRANARSIFTLTKLDSIPPNWTGCVGRINSDMIKTQIPNIQEYTVWISGPAEFVNEMWESVVHGCEVLPAQVHPIHFR